MTCELIHGIAMALPWQCHGNAMALPWQCHVIAMAMPWQCHGNSDAILGIPTLLRRYFGYSDATTVFCAKCDKITPHDYPPKIRTLVVAQEPTRGGGVVLATAPLLGLQTVLGHQESVPGLSRIKLAIESY